MPNKIEKPTAVVVNDAGPNGYGVILNLGRAGIPVISVNPDPKNITFYSRYAAKAVSPGVEKETELIEFLIGIGKRLSPKPVLFITGDIALLVILRHKHKLEKYFHFPIADLAIIEKLVNKKYFYQTLQEIGADHPRTYFPRDLSEVEAVRTDLHYPYIVKPVNSQSFKKKLGVKILKVNSARELIESYKKATDAGEEVVLQQEIPGEERYLVYTYFNRNLKPVAVACYKKVRLSPRKYGNACVCESVWEPEVVDFVLGVIAKLKFWGLAEPEVQRDPRDGRLKLIEINARSTTETRLSAALGMNMEFLAYSECIGKPIENNLPLNNARQKKVKWITITEDLYTVFHKDGYLAHKEITIREWLKSLKGKREYAFLAWDDPLPFVVEFFRFLRSFIFKGSVYRRFFLRKNSWYSGRNQVS
ncbi:MAG: hypothetical protein QME81_12405 [bacterium]|nr:hypothetical protein [bacterium]